MDANKVTFIVATIFQIPSFVCAVYIFLRYTKRRSPLRRLQNHLLMYLLVVATWAIVIELPNTQKYLWSGSVSIPESWFCLIWNISYLSTAAINRILMATMSVERHFLVFRAQIYRTRRSRLLFHYIPIIFLISTTLIYLFVTNLFISCPQMRFKYSQFMCGYTCSILIRNLSSVYTWGSVFIPTITTIIGCVLLPIRFVLQKRQIQQIDWNRARKMILQTTAIATVYSVCWLPYTIILQLLANNILSYSNRYIIQFLAITPYITSFLTPFIVYHTIRKPTDVKMLERLKRLFFWKRQGAVRPAQNFMAQKINCGTADARNTSRL